MFGLPPSLGASADQPLRVVCLGAHADDIEIGAGGTVLRLLRERPHTDVRWAVLSATAERAAEARASAHALLTGAARASVDVHDLDDGGFPQSLGRLRALLRDGLQAFAPHLVLTHRLDDAHQDHRAVAEVTWQTFRGAQIATYEVPKWDGDLHPPNAYVVLQPEDLDRKLAVLADHFASQRDKPWFDDETFRGLARVRGVEAGARYAEGFHCRKLVW